MNHELPVISPSSGEIIGHIAPATPQQVEAAVLRGREAQWRWARESTKRRCEQLACWRLALIKAGDQLAQLLSSENGKPLHESWLHEVVPLCDTLSWLTEEGAELLQEVEVPLRWMKHQRSTAWSKPRGLCAVISPYNFPLLIPFADAAAALMTGCAVIIKPSERTPLIARSVVALAEQSGLAPGLLQVVVGHADVAQHLIACGVDEVVFTGSSDHGRSVAVRCAEQLVPCTLELGGGAAAVVFEDANIEQAASALTFGALANSGQSCIAIERVYAPRCIHSRLVDAIAGSVSSLRQGNPLHDGVDLGAMTSEQQLTKVTEQIAATVAKGATLVCGGKRSRTVGNFLQPSVLANCTPEMPIVCEEIFGPVVPIVCVNDSRDLLPLSNRGAPSLMTYLFGQDRKTLQTAARESAANHVLINDVLWSYACPELPFGGHGRSGWGVVHGPQGLLAHTHRAHIGQPRLRLPNNLGFGFPYTRAPLTLLKHAMRFFTR